MIQRSPATYRATPWYLLLALTLSVFLIKGCAEPRSERTVSEPTAPQLAAATANCTVGSDGEPCIVVRVKAPGNMTLPEGLIVTLVAGSDGPFDASGRLLKRPILDGVAVFEYDGGYQLAPGGYCAWVAPVTELEAFTAGGTFIVPTSIAVPMGSAEPVGGAVSDTQRKSVPLTKAAYEHNCLWFYVSSQPPGVLELGNSLTFDLTLQTAASIEARCHSTQGSGSGQGATVECPTWGVVALDEDDEGNPLSIEEIVQKFPWLDPALYSAGVRVGILASLGYGNASLLNGLTPGQAIAIETAQGDFTASASDKTPKGGSKKKPPETEAVDLDYLPLVCRDETEPAEPEDPGVSGIDLFTVHHGYLGYYSLATDRFEANPRRVAFWYRYVVRSNGSTTVQLHARLKQRPGETDNFPENINLVETVDFSDCPIGAPDPSHIVREIDEENSVIVDVSCRRPVDATDASDELEAVWDFTFPGSRQVELRLEVVDGDGILDTYPDPARADDTRSMVLQEFTPGYCPLSEGTIGKSNDPKWCIEG